MLTPATGLLFALLALMVLGWFAGVQRLSRLLRQRHPQLHGELRFADLWPHNLGEWLRGYNNAGPVFSLLRFVLGRGDRALGDVEVSRATTFLQRLFWAYLALFILEGVLIVRTPPLDTPEVAAWRERQRSEQAFRPHREKRLPEAIAAYDRLLAEREADAPMHFWRGVAHEEAGHAERALADYRRAIELDAVHLEAHRRIGAVLSRQGRWGDIVTLWDGYLERQPDDAEARFQRSGALFRQGDRKAARADADRACALGRPEACAWAMSLAAMAQSAPAPAMGGLPASGPSGP